MAFNFSSSTYFNYIKISNKNKKKKKKKNILIYSIYKNIVNQFNNNHS